MASLGIHARFALEALVNACEALMNLYGDLVDALMLP